MTKRTDQYRGKSYLYCVQRANGDIKIGYSFRLPHRFSGLKKRHGELAILGVMPGDESDEAAIHEMFDQFCVRVRNPRNGGLHRSDWFSPAPEILKWISENTEAYEPYEEQMRRNGYNGLADKVERMYKIHSTSYYMER